MSLMSKDVNLIIQIVDLIAELRINEKAPYSPRIAKLYELHKQLTTDCVQTPLKEKHV